METSEKTRQLVFTVETSERPQLVFTVETSERPQLVFTVETSERPQLVFTVETSEKTGNLFSQWKQVITGQLINDMKYKQERSMPLEEYKLEHEVPAIVFEFTPFTKDHLVRYLRNISIQSDYLQERQNNLYHQLRMLERDKIVNGQNIDERIQMFAYGSRSGDDLDFGYSGNHYNPDTLFNRWVKIFEPYETHRRVLTNSIFKVLYRQWQLECVYQCVDQLDPRQRDVILHIYIRKEKVKEYCMSLQMGHNNYNQLKDKALDTLLITCNNSLSNLQKNWEGINAETARISDFMPHRGWSNRNMACV